MPSFAELTKGCLMDIMSGSENVGTPTVQILGSKRVSGNVGDERYRLLISDGKYLHSFAMLATQLNDMQKAGKLCDFTIMRIDKFMCSMVNRSNANKKRVLIILEVTVLNDGSDVQVKIGSPVPIPDLDSAGSGSTGTAPSARSSPPKSNGNTFQPRAAPAASAMNSSMATQSLSDQLILPITSLSPYQNKWVIKARVTSKSQIRKWSNQKGEGQLFSMDLCDETGEIRATAFRDQVDKFFDVMEVDKVFYISRCTLKAANKQFSSLNNDYEMTFGNETIVQECIDDIGGIPAVSYNFIPIATIANMEPNTLLDVIGVCRDVSDLFEFTSKNGKELKKKEVTLVDKSDACICLTLWGDEAEKFDGIQQPVIMLKNARINEFAGGKTLATNASTVMKMNPDMEESHALRGWFNSGGGESITNSVSARTGAGAGSMVTEWMTFAETKENNLGNGDKPDYFQTKAAVLIVKSNNSVYKACPQPDCNKKAIDQENGNYRCEKCNSDFPNFKYRLMLQLNIGDWTSNRWITCFADLAEQLLERNSQEVGEALEINPDEAEEIFSNLTFKNFVFKLRTKVDFYGDTPRNKITAISASKINHKEFNTAMCKELSVLTGIGSL